ncbi:hypothetical protein MKX01_035439 [Papaver californicum]|nr:hypothetical protein MKX01_035439 [Papaver californicum]
MTFDVGSEKFSTIKVPNYIFDQPGYDVNFVFYNVRLLELDGRGTPKLWLFDGDDRNKKNSTSSWTHISMELPYTFDTDWYGVSFNPIPGTNHIILSSYVYKYDGKICDTTYHRLYNWKTKSFSEIEFNGSVPIFTLESRVAIFFENLLPVRKQTSTTI